MTIGITFSFNIIYKNPWLCCNNNNELLLFSCIPAFGGLEQGYATTNFAHNPTLR